MKKSLSVLLMLTLAINGLAQQQDPIAIKILDRMSDIIGNLSSCRYTLLTIRDLHDFDYGMITKSNTHEVYMSGPDKMLINSNGDNGHKEYFYNGSLLCYYNFDEHNYAEIETPPTIMETIDTINKLYGIDFPAADFFYPTFTDDLIDYADRISYAGTADVEGKECFHIIASNSAVHVQFWISNDATMLPKKMVINYKSDKGISRYETTFNEWQLNPVLPDSMFDFMQPPGSNLVTMIPKK